MLKSLNFHANFFFLQFKFFLGARLWLMIGFIASFACLVAGIWIMFGDYVFNKNSKDSWPGVALFLHTFLIFISSMVYKFGRTEELWD